MAERIGWGPRRRTYWIPSLVVPVGALLVLGLLTVYSATALRQGGDGGMVVRHLVAVALGCGMAALLAWLPPRALEDFSPFLYGGSLLALLLVLLAGSAHSGAQRWLELGPLQIQPAEPAKLVFVLFLAHFLGRKRCDLRRITTLAAALALIVLPFVLVLREPDLGTAMAFPAVGAMMLIWAGLPWMTLALLASPLVTALLAGLRFLSHSSAVWLGLLWIPVVAAGAAWLRRRGFAWVLVGAFVFVQLVVALEVPRLWNHLEPYQRARVTAFVSPERDPNGAGYQIIQSKIAIGSGCLLGRGYGRGSQKALSFLPRQHTDFIYSVVGEEFGFWGAGLVLALYALLLLRAITLARNIRSRFGSLVEVGCATLIGYHVVVNVGMTLGLAPVTGLPLPFLSYGGSFLISCLGAVGLMLGAAARRNEY
jgi:rod shape determining protein RodA